MDAIDARLLGILATLTNWDDDGRTLPERYDIDDILALEAAGLVRVDRPLDDATDLPRPPQHWKAFWSDAGTRYVVRHYRHSDYQADGRTPKKNPDSD